MRDYLFQILFWLLPIVSWLAVFIISKFEGQYSDKKFIPSIILGLLLLFSFLNIGIYTSVGINSILLTIVLLPSSLVALITATILKKKKSRVNDEKTVEKEKSILYIIFSGLLFVICEFFILVNWKNFSDFHGDYVPQNFYVLISFLFIIVAFLIISVIIKYQSKRKVYISVLILVSILLPITTYAFNCYLIGENGVFRHMIIWRFQQ